MKYLNCSLNRWVALGVVVFMIGTTGMKEVDTDVVSDNIVSDEIVPDVFHEPTEPSDFCRDLDKEKPEIQSLIPAIVRARGERLGDLKRFVEATDNCHVTVLQGRSPGTIVNESMSVVKMIAYDNAGNRSFVYIPVEVKGFKM